MRRGQAYKAALLGMLVMALAAMTAACRAGPGDQDRAAPVALTGDAVAVVALGTEPTLRPAIVTLVAPTPAPKLQPTSAPTASAAPAARMRGPYPAPGESLQGSMSGQTPATPAIQTLQSPLATSQGVRASGATSGSGGAAPTRVASPTRFTATARPTVPTLTPAPTEDRRLVLALQTGGYVIYLRHAATDWGHNDRELAWVPEMLLDRSLLADCDRQRLLTDQGRDQAQAIGERIRAQGIPVGRVLVSPWCRTRETAALAFGGGDVAADVLFDTGYLPAGSAERTAFRAALREVLGAQPEPGANTFLVGHMPQLNDAAGLQLAEGEAAIFEPRGGESFRLVKRVGPEGWQDLGNR